MSNPRAAALHQASTQLGGPDLLAVHLGVPEWQLEGWLKGLEPVPDSVFLKAVDVVSLSALKSH